MRFNFRGVGGSEGSYDGGRGEVGDVLAAMEYLRTKCFCEMLVLCGYSFGAAVALKALRESGAAGFVAVALPTETSPEVYGDIPVEVAVPSLLAAGDMDEICRLENIERFAKFSQPPEILGFERCDHFFSSVESLNELCDNVVRFVGDIGKGQA